MPSHKLAFFFPAFSKIPQLIWLPCTKTCLLDKEGVTEAPDTKDLLGVPDNTKVERIPVVRNGLYSSNSTGDKYTLIIYSRVNPSVVYKGGLNSRWNGPHVVIHQNGNYNNPYTTISDVNLGDFSNTLAFMREYDMACNGIRPLEMNPMPPIQSRIMGVRINCDADMGLDSSKYEAVEVAGNHPIYKSYPTYQSELFRLPLLLRKLPRSRTSQQGSEKGSRENTIASVLCLDLNLDSDTWCEPQTDWQGDVGSVLVARMDKKSITPQQVCAIIEWWLTAVHEASGSQTPADDSKVPPERMNRTMFTQRVFTQDSFETYLEEIFKPQLVHNGLKSYADVMSPFRV